MTAYYNEIDPYAAQWLRNLINKNLIAPGDVDERSIVDVQADDLKGYAQCHFFAGIGGWSLAARLAGWPDSEPLWSGSCPCQPLSSAGQRKGHADQRHLWPSLFDLIAKLRPPVVFGEQVASADGREWLSGVRADLEELGYACGAADLCAAGVGAPHRRQRLYWLAHPSDARFNERKLGNETGQERKAFGRGQDQRGWWNDPSHGRPANHWLDFIDLECRDGRRRASPEPSAFPLAYGVSDRVGQLRAYGNAIVPQLAAEVIGAFIDLAPTDEAKAEGEPDSPSARTAPSRGRSTERADYPQNQEADDAPINLG